MIFRELYCLYKHSSINLIAKIIQMTSQKVSRCRMIIPRHGVIHIFWFHYPSRLFIFFTLFKHSSRHFSTGVITGAKTGGALRLIMSLRFTTIIIPVINSLTHTSENLTLLTWPSNQVYRLLSSGQDTIAHHFRQSALTQNIVHNAKFIGYIKLIHISHRYNKRYKTS